MIADTQQIEAATRLVGLLRGAAASIAHDVAIDLGPDADAATTQPIVERFLAAVAAGGARVGEADLVRLRAEGAAAARRGHPLAAPIDAYLSTAWVAWDHALRIVPTPDPIVLGTLGAALLRAGDDIVAALADGFTAAERALASTAGAMRQAILEELLTTPVTDAAAMSRLSRRAALVGLDMASTYHVLVLRPEADGEGIAELVEELVRRLARDPARRPSLVAERGQDVVAIAGGAWRDGAPFGDVVGGLSLSAPWSATLAGPTALDGLAVGYAEAVDALRVVPVTSGSGRVVAVRDVALERALVADSIPRLARCRPMGGTHPARGTRWSGAGAHPRGVAGRRRVRRRHRARTAGRTTDRQLPPRPGGAPPWCPGAGRRDPGSSIDGTAGPSTPGRVGRQRAASRTASIEGVSELRPSSPVRRPDTARPRTADVHEHGPTTPVEPPPSVDPVSIEELVRIERHMASLPVHVGAEVTQDDALGVLMIRQRGAGAAVNYAAMPRWEASTWRASIDRLGDVMRADGSWPSLLLADRLDRPPGLVDVMPSLGWRRLLGEMVLWVGHASVVPHLDPRLRFEAVQPRSVDDHEALERHIFGVDPARAEARRRELAAALAGGRLRAFIVRLDGEPIAVARLSQGDGVAGIYALGVALDWRDRGYGTLMTTIATRAGMATGNRVVWLSVEDGNTRARHVYEKLGFQPAFGWARWLAPAD